MPDAIEFEEFYLATRRRLVLQTYALTGDLAAARAAVREAFVAASHHWRKVGRLPEPEEWVRPRAWAMAQRRHVARIWHREKGIGPEQAAVLERLQPLTDLERRVLLLTHLAGLSVPETGREVGETANRVQQVLDKATDGLSDTIPGLAGDLQAPDAIRRWLEQLAPVAEAAALPRPAMIVRNGRRRRQTHLVVGAAAVVALTVLSGIMVVTTQPDDNNVAGSEPTPRPLRLKMLLNTQQTAKLAPQQQWTLTAQGDNTEGTGLNSVCQTSRFADESGLKAFVRTFTAPGSPPSTPQLRLVETAELSSSPEAAAAAYQTTLGWYAGCTAARVQLLNTYQVSGMGEEARVLRLRLPDSVRRSYLVGVVRTGEVTVSTLLETAGGRPVELNTFMDTLTAAMSNLCGVDDTGACVTEPAVSPVLPPPSGETPGTLSVADLPPIGKIARPWVGTKPVPGQPNLAATSCDRANFVAGGAPAPLSRTFLIPQAKLPPRFGVTETWGAFPGEPKARALLSGVVAKMRSCEDRDLGAKVSSEIVVDKGFRGSSYAMWRLDSQINDKRETVGYWMGIVRVGRHVAQVTFTPGGRADMDEETFRAMVTRTRDRLFELEGS